MEAFDKTKNYDWSMTIWFNDLMDECVRYIPMVLERPYILTLNGKKYQFAGTEQIVPFVEEKLGWTVLLEK